MWWPLPLFRPRWPSRHKVHHRPPRAIASLIRLITSGTLRPATPSSACGAFSKAAGADRPASIAAAPTTRRGKTPSAPCARPDAGTLDPNAPDMQACAHTKPARRVHNCVYIRGLERFNSEITFVLYKSQLLEAFHVARLSGVGYLPLLVKERAVWRRKQPPQPPNS